MRKFFFSLVALFCATVCFAQGSMLATLKHDDTITTFYGSGALKEAYTAATHGDVITLSSGTFLATDIKKAITIRGAGMGIDTTMVVEPTVITGDFTINIADSISSRFVLEGIYSNNTIKYVVLKNAMFMKCRLKRVSYYGSSALLTNATFLHCRIAELLSLISNCSASCVNCVINSPCFTNTSDASFEFVNCVIRETSSSTSSVSNSSYKNCIIISPISYFYINSSSTCFNCVGIGHSGMFLYMTNSTNKVVDNASVFKTYQSGTDFAKLDSETFELVENAKTQYLGIDGTQVGIHGGNLPFEATPTNPQITKCAVASKSTADGKLSVDIQVKTAD